MKDTKSGNKKIRISLDLLLDKNEFDKEIYETFFKNASFQHDSLSMINLNNSDTIKCILMYYKKNVLDLNKEKIKKSQIQTSSIQENFDNPFG